jgi:4-azaleucine resistance transporter AzlC
MSVGVRAREAGMSVVGAVVMSMIVFAGSAQVTALTIIVGGGGLGPALLGAALMNSRFLPMGIALAPSLPGGPVRRALEGQTVVDSSWALARREDGTFDRWLLFGTTVPQYVMWTFGTLTGALAGDALGDLDRYGIDAIYPTFFLALLLHEVQDPTARVAALGGAGIALVLVPFTPAGVPVLVASLAALYGLRRQTA